MPAGSQVQRPLAIVVVGGMLTTLFLTRYLMPVLYSFYGHREPPAGSSSMAQRPIPRRPASDVASGLLVCERPCVMISSSARSRCSVLSAAALPGVLTPLRDWLP